MYRLPRVLQGPGPPTPKPLHPKLRRAYDLGSVRVSSIRQHIKLHKGSKDSKRVLEGFHTGSKRDLSGFYGVSIKVIGSYGFPTET